MAINYVQAIALYYPNYTLTKIGDGTVYENIQWSIFNPTGPIAKSTLDTLIANNVNNFTADLSLNADELLELSSIGSITDNSNGLIRKLANNLYTLDTSVYLTSSTLTSTDITDALGYFPYNSTNPNNYTTKAYVDGLVSTGSIWQEPIHAFNFTGTASAPPATANENENYIISAGGNTGVWSSFQPGDRVSWVGGQWVLREVTTIACRLGICFDRTTTPVGDAAGYQDYIGEIIGGDAINGWVWQWTAPQNNFAVFNNLAASTKFGQAYTYVGSESKWIPFASGFTVQDGNGLSFTTNVLNVNTGSGIQIASDMVSSRLYPAGGLMTTLDGITSNTTSSAALCLSTVGTPGTYRSVSVDLYGRVTDGTNPTTLNEYGISSIDWSYLVNTPNTLAGYGIIANLVDLANVTITNPINGQFLSYDGTKWVNTTVNLGGVSSISTVQPTEGLTVTGGPITSSGTLTFSLANDLAAIEALNGIGFYSRTGTDTWTARTIVGSTNISVTNSDGSVGNPTINLTTIGSSGTYKSVTVDTYGRVTDGTNPTTLSGFGITDAAPISATYLVLSNNALLTNERALTGTANQILLTDNGSNNTLELSIADNPILPGNNSVTIPIGDTSQRPLNSEGLFRYNSSTSTLEYSTSSEWITLGTSGGSVTSVALSAPAEFVISGSPVTTSGTLTLTKANQLAKTVYAGPITGTARPTFRTIALSTGDISDVVITTPSVGQALYYNGANWVNFGTTGTSGGAAKRIWSDNVPSSSGTTTIVPSITPPLITAGTEVWNLTITPFGTTATYVIQSSQSVAASLNNANLSLALFKTIGGVSTYIGGTLQIVSSGTNSSTLSFFITDKPNTTSPVTYSVRVGTTSGTWYVNQRSSEITYGGLKSGWMILEY